MALQRLPERVLAAGKDVVDEAAHGERVHRARLPIAADLLRRLPAHRAGHLRMIARLLALQLLAQPHVADLRVAVEGDEHVLRLQVAVDDLAIVERGEPAQNLLDEPHAVVGQLTRFLVPKAIPRREFPRLLHALVEASLTNFVRAWRRRRLRPCALARAVLTAAAAATATAGCGLRRLPLVAPEADDARPLHHVSHRALTLLQRHVDEVAVLLPAAAAHHVRMVVGLHEDAELLARDIVKLP